MDGLQLALQPVLDVPSTQRLGFEHESLFCQHLVELAPLVRLVGRDENQVAVRRHVAELAHERLGRFAVSRRLALAEEIRARDQDDILVGKERRRFDAREQVIDGHVAADLL